MKNIIEAAKKGGVLRWNYTTCTDNTYKNGAWEQEKFNTIYTYCLKAIHEISENPDDLNGNILIGSPSAVAALEAISMFEIFDDISYDGDVHRIGKVGRFIVYRDMSANEDYIVVAKTKDLTIKTIINSRFLHIEELRDLA